MANEAKINVSLQIKKGNITYASQPSGFQADVDSDPVLGPTPGAFEVSTQGTDADLSRLTAPGGLCRIQNLDEDNYVTWGAYDPVSTVFQPLGELLPGESYILRLSRSLGDEYTGTGTGSDVNGTLRFRADTDSCIVLVEAFDV